MSKRLTARQKKAITALIYCTNVREAAREVDVPYSTLRGWLTNNYQFKEALNAELQKLTQDAGISVTAGFSEAVDTLRSILSDSESDAARTAAAKALIEAKLRLLNVSADVSTVRIVVDV